VLTIAVAVPLAGLCGLYCVARLVGDPGWGYHVRGAVRPKTTRIREEVADDHVGVTTRVGAFLFAGSLGVD
jgi:hypothetical protein